MNLKGDPIFMKRYFYVLSDHATLTVEVDSGAINRKRSVYRGDALEGAVTCDVNLYRVMNPPDSLNPIKEGGQIDILDIGITFSNHKYWPPRVKDVQTELLLTSLDARLKLTMREAAEVSKMATKPPWREPTCSS